MTNKQDKRKDEPMKPFSIRMPDDLVKKANEKAGTLPLSAVIRRLVEKWLKGEISID